MDIFSVSSTHHYCHSSPLSSAILAGKSQQISSSLTLSLTSSSEPNQSANPPRLSGEIRRPPTHLAPLRNLVTPSSTTLKNPDNLTNKLWLFSKISPAPPLPGVETEDLEESKDKEDEIANAPHDADSGHVPAPEFRREGKVFDGNLPLWIEKNEVAEFFRQFGPIKHVILIKGHSDP